MKQRNAKLEASNSETKNTISKPIEELKAKDYLTISETSKLTSVSRWTIWRAIKNNELKAGKLGRTTLIKRTDLDTLIFKNR